jgi:hypothetical protein
VVVHLAIPCVSVCMTASSAAEFAAAVGALLDKAVYLFRTQGGAVRKNFFCLREEHGAESQYSSGQHHAP